jgi:hypothetical protein
MTSHEETVCDKGKCAPLQAAFVADSGFIEGHRQSYWYHKNQPNVDAQKRALENSPSELLWSRLNHLIEVV